jgi:hypothetical protein
MSPTISLMTPNTPIMFETSSGNANAGESTKAVTSGHLTGTVSATRRTEFGFVTKVTRFARGSRSRENATFSPKLVACSSRVIASGSMPFARARLWNTRASAHSTKAWSNCPFCRSAQVAGRPHGISVRTRSRKRVSRMNSTRQWRRMVRGCDRYRRTPKADSHVPIRPYSFLYLGESITSWNSSPP